MNTQDFFDGVTQSILLQRQEINDEIQELQYKIDERKADLRKLDKMLKATDDSPQKKTAKKKSPNTGEKHAQSVLEFISNSHNSAGWTAKEISESIGVSRNGVNNALSYLRDNEKIRAVRRVQGGGHAYGPW